MTFLRHLVVCLLFALPAAAQDAFDVPVLNAGLPEPGPQVDRSTPRGAVASFVDLTAEGNDARAAQLLNLNDIPPEAQAQAGPILARQLAFVMSRKIIVDWGSLPERSDAMNETAPSEDPLAGETRRSLSIGTLDLEHRPVTLRIDRLQPDGGEPVWVFSASSVRHIPALYALYGPSILEQRLPDWARESAFAGLQWWEVIGLPIIALIAAGVSWLCWHGLDAAARHQPSEIVTRLIRATRLPVTLLILALTISLSTAQVFVVSGVVDNLTSPIVIVLYVAAAVILAVNVVDAILARTVRTLDVEDLASPEHGAERAQATTVAALRRLAIVIAIMVGVGVVLTSARIFSGLGLSLLASAGGVALVLGFAAREVLGNIMASMQISLNRSARVGDQLIYDDHLCTVERIHFTFVQLKVWDDTRLIVPVSNFISQSFINRSTETYGMIRHAILTFAPDVDVRELRAHFDGWAASDDRVDGDEAETLAQVVGQSDSGIEIRFAAHVTDPTAGWEVECDMREEMLRYAVELSARDGLEYVPHLGTASDGGSVDPTDDDGES